MNKFKHTYVYIYIYMYGKNTCTSKIGAACECALRRCTKVRYTNVHYTRVMQNFGSYERGPSARGRRIEHRVEYA